MKLSEWRLRMKDQISSNLDKLAGKADGLSGKFMRLQERLNRFTSQGGGLMSRMKGVFTNFFSSVGSQISSFSGSLSGMMPMMGGGLSSLLNPATAVTATVLGLGVASTTMAMSFDKGMAKINGTLQLAPPQLAKLRNEIITLGKEGTAPIESLPDAFEKIVSQTGDAGLSMDILKTSLKGAQAGFADVNLVSSAVAQTLSIVGKQNTTANEVMDTLFKAKKVGAGEFSDFANYMPQLIAAGDALKIGFKDTAGVFAYMTAKGQSAADSATLIQNAYTALGKSEITTKLAESGVKIFDDAGNMRALDLIFKDLAVKTKDMSGQQKALYLESIGLMDVQARNAFAILSSDADLLQSTMGSVRDSAGELNNQLEATATPSQKWDNIMNRIKGGMIEIGYKIMPYIEKAFNWIIELAKGVSGTIMDWYNNSELVQDIVWAIGKLFEGIWWVVTKIADLLSWIWTELVEPLWQKISDAYSTLKAIFQGDWDKVMTISMQNDPHAKAIEEATGMKMQMVDGKMQLVAPEGSGSLAKMMKPGQSPQGDTAVMPGAPGTEGGKGTADLKNNLQKGSNSISEGGKQQRIINVHIGKLNESINVHSTTISESASDLEQKFIEMFLRVTQGAEVAMAQSGS